MLRKILRKEIMSRKILKQLLDDFSIFGSVPFYFFMAVLFHIIGIKGIALKLVLAWFLGFAVILLIKSFHYKDRPNKEDFDIFMEKIIASSFPSSHSMSVTVFAILVSIAYPIPLLISIMVVISLLVFLQRYVAKKHFIGDIIGGVLIGITISVFVSYLL